MALCLRDSFLPCIPRVIGSLIACSPKHRTGASMETEGERACRGSATAWAALTLRTTEPPYHVRGTLRHRPSYTFSSTLRSFRKTGFTGTYGWRRAAARAYTLRSICRAVSRVFRSRSALSPRSARCREPTLSSREARSAASWHRSVRVWSTQQQPRWPTSSSRTLQPSLLRATRRRTPKIARHRRQQSSRARLMCWPWFGNS